MHLGKEFFQGLFQGKDGSVGFFSLRLPLGLPAGGFGRGEQGAHGRYDQEGQQDSQQAEDDTEQTHFFLLFLFLLIMCVAAHDVTCGLLGHCIRQGGECKCKWEEIGEGKPKKNTEKLNTNESDKPIEE